MRVAIITASNSMEREEAYNDPLTEAIFSAVDAGPSSFSPSETGGSILVGKEDEDALSEAIFASVDMSLEAPSVEFKQERETLLHEIESIDFSEHETDVVDLRETPLVEQLGTPKAQSDEKLVRPMFSALPEVAPEDVARAEDNWFGARLDSYTERQVRSADLGDRFFPRESSRGSVFKKIILSLFVGSVLASAAWLISSSSLLSDGLPFFKDNQIVSSSFVLLNAEEDVVFEPLFLLRANIESEQNSLLSRAAENSSRKEELSAASKELGNMALILDRFFQDNQTFSWLNAFRKSFSPYPVSISLVDDVIRAKEVFEQKRGITLEPTNRDLHTHRSWILFWEKILSSNGQYLIVGTHPEHQNFSLGEPATYALVSAGNNGLDVISSGQVADLNGALGTKIIPPEPIQAIKTSFDFFESSWFLSTENFGSIFSNLFSQTTGSEVDGVFFLGHNFLSELARKPGFLIDPNSSRWPEQLISALSRRSPNTWKDIEQVFKSAVRANELNIYLKDDSLEKFVLSKNMAMGVEMGSKEDFFSFGLRSWEGESVVVDGIEYEPEIFNDGSLESRLSFTLRNQDSNFKNSYLKIYIPLSSNPLEIEGFSPRREPASFAYQANGFLPNKYFNTLDDEDLRKKFKEIDFSKEGDFMVVGIWVSMSPKERQNISLAYRLPFRLNKQRGVDNYSLRVLKPGGFSALPFSFKAIFSDNVDFSWQSPQGFIADNLAQYQATLREDATISATVKFSN